jgi:hypothetical protein
MTGGDDRDQPYYGKARIRIATLLSATACVLMLVDPFLPDYEPSIGVVALLLTTAGVLLGVEVLERRLK